MSKDKNKSVNGYTKTREEIIRVLKECGYDLENREKQNAAVTTCYSGSFATIHDFDRIGFDTPY